MWNVLFSVFLLFDVPTGESPSMGDVFDKWEIQKYANKSMYLPN